MKDRISQIISEVMPKRMWSNDNPLSLYMTSFKRHLVEGLINTFPLEAAKQHFVNYMGIDSDNFQIRKNNGVKVAVIYLEYNEEDIKDYEKAMEFYGYYLSDTQTVEGNDGTIICILIFEPKFQKNLKNGEDIESVINKYLSKEQYFMHVTPKKHLPKILKYGLCPRPSEKEEISYPNRIHLLGSIGKANAFFLAAQMYKREKNKTSNDGTYVILFLNKDEVLKYANLSFDPNTNRGYITSDNIPPSAIEEYEKINVNDRILKQR